MSPGHFGPAGLGRRLRGHSHPLGESLGGAPGGQPAVPTLTGSASRGVRPATDSDRNRRVGSWPDHHVRGVVELPVVVDPLPGQQWPEDVQGLVGAAAPGGRVHADRFHLMAVLPAYPHPEGEATGGLFGQRRDLAGHGHRVAEGQ